MASKRDEAKFMKGELGVDGQAVADERTPDQVEQAKAAGADVRIVAGEAGRVAPASLLEVLVELECNEVLVEAGPVVNGALLAAGLVDELVVYQAAHVLGDLAVGMDVSPRKIRSTYGSATRATVCAEKMLRELTR
jgi:diaminohydroxyphosphoribosylaminopyrimidine deaminase/5-amino-6-(5-phosphoribosylamino)uracil reductase